MPSLSINSKDLDTLGINLKDLLKAISHTKGDTNEVIKIKKRKKKGKQKTKNIRTNKANLISPFPNNQPKFTQYPQMGSSGAFFPSSRVERVEVTKQPEPQQNNKQLDEFQNKMEKQLNATSDATRLLLADRFYTNKFFPSQNNPPPANLEYLPFNTFREPIQVDRQDRFGIVQTNDFYSNARNNDGEGFSVEELPDELPTLDEPTMQTDTPAENIDMKDVPSGQSSTEDEPIQIIGAQSSADENNVEDLYPQEKEVTPRRMPFTTPKGTRRQELLPVEEEPTYQELPDLNTLVEEVKKGRRGRPAGSKNKPKNPLVAREAHPTRSNHDDLLDPTSTNLGISPYALAKQNNRKQKMLNQYFKNKKLSQNDEETDD